MRKALGIGVTAMTVVGTAWLAVQIHMDTVKETAADRSAIEKLKAELAEAKSSAISYRERLMARNQDLEAAVGALADLQEAVQGLNWQMEMVIKTCPGRARPPRLPAPAAKAPDPS